MSGKLVNLFMLPFMSRRSRYPLSCRLLEEYLTLASLRQKVMITGFLRVIPESRWRLMEEIIEDVMGITEASLKEIAWMLKWRSEVESNDGGIKDFPEIFERVYNQPAYPIGLHIAHGLVNAHIKRREFILRQIRSMDRVNLIFADIGCGSGFEFACVLKEKPGWFGYGLDISPHNLEYARRLMRCKELEERARFLVCDLRRIPLADASLDLVIVSEVLEHIPGPEEGLKEIFRVLRPSGRAIITVPLRHDRSFHLYVFQHEAELAEICQRERFSVIHLEVQRMLEVRRVFKYCLAVAVKDE
jgi:SAM-dependent methyltransferase